MRSPCPVRDPAVVAAVVAAPALHLLDGSPFDRAGYLHLALHHGVDSLISLRCLSTVADPATPMAVVLVGMHGCCCSFCGVDDSLDGSCFSIVPAAASHLLWTTVSDLAGCRHLRHYGVSHVILPAVAVAKAPAAVVLVTVVLCYCCCGCGDNGRSVDGSFDCCSQRRCLCL